MTTRRLAFLLLVALACVRWSWDPAGSIPWLSVMALAAAEAGLRWSVAAAWGIVALAGGLGLTALALGALPGWLWGAWGASLLTAGLLTAWMDRLRKGMAHWETALAEAERRESSMEKEREGLRALSREKEAAIQEMSAMYQLSRQFLGTLDVEEGLRVTRDFLGRTVPSVGEETLDLRLGDIRAMVDNGKVSAEALIQAIPLRGTAYADRERWSVLSNQLALGLQRISLYRQVQDLATHDGLTGLMVRRYFKERLAGEVAAALRKGAPVSFLMVDLDRFKTVNDTYGHLVGDVVLREVARLIRSSVREMDLVGRYGGEEFSVVLPDADEKVGLHIAERIRAGVEGALIQAYDEQIRITVSVGLSLLPKHASTAEQLIDQADRAMYRAKGAGRNRTVIAE